MTLMRASSPLTSDGSRVDYGGFARDARHILAEALSSYEHELSLCKGEQEQFLVRLNYMFSDFVLPEERKILEIQAPGDRVFSMEDNLDTGNPSFPPFSGFVRGLSSAVQDADSYRKYLGPRIVPSVEEAFKVLLKKVGIFSDIIRESSTFAFGAGTVHLYDSLLRFLVRRENDVVILPTVGYGFFIPQVERTGGRIEWCPISEDRGFKITPEELDALVQTTNKELLQAWRESRVELLIYEIQRRIGRELPDASRAILEQAIEQAASAEYVDALVRQIVADHSSDKELSANCLERYLPPRVVAFLHINPNVHGSSYSEQEVRDIATVCETNQVTVIEDLAFALMRIEEDAPSVFSILEVAPHAFSLIGLSKPFSLSTARIGAVASRRADMALFFRYIEGSIGYLSELYQRAIETMAQAPESELITYLDICNRTGPHSYRRRRDLLIGLLRGSQGINSVEACNRQEVLSELGSLSQAMGSTDSFGALPLGSLDLQQRFLDEGLSNWLEVEVKPDYGMFLIVNVEPLIDRSQKLGFPLSSSFEVFAFLARFCGVRTIPEETLGLAPGHQPRRLRLSYAPSPRALIWSCYIVFLALNSIEVGELHHDTK